MPLTLSPNIQNMLTQLAQRQSSMQDLMQTQTGAMPYSIAPSGGIPKVQMGAGGGQSVQGPPMPQPAAPQNQEQAPNIQPSAPNLPQDNTSQTVAGVPTPSTLVQNLQYYLQNGMLPSPASSGGQGTPAPASAGGTTNPTIQTAMQITGVDASWAPYLNQLVQRENASGDPNAINPTAVGGEHATGFLQTLPSTFKANAAPGMTNINDPVANAVAAINYIKSRYGSPANIPGLMSGSYHGY